MQSDNEIRYVNTPSRVTSSIPWIVALAVGIVALLLLLAMGFQQSPMMSAAFVIVLLVGMLGWVLDSRSRARAHAEQLTRVHETVPQAVAPAISQSVMQIVAGVLAQGWLAGEQGGSAAPMMYRPPQAVSPQLPARVVPVMRYISGGRAIPLGAPAHQPIVLETETGDDDESPGQKLRVPLNYLMRFAACATPARIEWQGNSQIYGECARFFIAHGMLTPGQRGGYAWPPEYPIQSRRSWLMQHESAGLSAGAPPQT